MSYPTSTQYKFWSLTASQIEKERQETQVPIFTSVTGVRFLMTVGMPPLNK